MGLSKYKLGELLIRNTESNAGALWGIENVRGLLNTKKISNTKANVTDRDLTKFLVVRPRGFVFNHRVHDKLGLGYNTSEETYLFTNDYVAFYVKPEVAETVLLPDYLYIWYLRPEFDRYMLFKTYGSATLFFSWDNMCELEIQLPDIAVQQKYVDIYNAMLANQQSYERGLEDLKLVCDAYIEDLRRKMPCEEIGKYIEEKNEKNIGDKITLFQGVNVDHVFTDPKRIAEDSENGTVVRNGQFAFNKVMKAHNTKLPIALREGEDCVVSSSYQVFEIIAPEKLLAKYLLLWLNRAETQRYAGFIAFGTTRDIFTFEDMRSIKIPIPSLKIQQSIVEIFEAYQIRNEICEKLKSQIKNICPILIKGSIEEARREA